MGTNKQTLISIIIPVYNGAAYLGAALQSVLQQSYRPLEIIVINDGSTDETAAIVSTFQQGLYPEHGAPSIHYFYQPNGGPATARNRGVAQAQGELLAFLDADDWWHPQKLERQMALFAQQPALGYVVTHMCTHLEAQTSWPNSLNQAHYQHEPPCFLPSALVVRRSVFQQIGNFDERYRYSDDADWFLRAKDAAIPFAVAPETLVYKRIHATNLSHTPAMTQETLRAFHASVQRQRQAQQATKVQP